MVAPGSAVSAGTRSNPRPCCAVRTAGEIPPERKLRNNGRRRLLDWQHVGSYRADQAGGKWPKRSRLTLRRYRRGFPHGKKATSSRMLPSANY
jgi:hypothetical protein